MIARLLSADCCIAHKHRRPAPMGMVLGLARGPERRVVLREEAFLDVYGKTAAVALLPRRLADAP
jgi:hypothetical protein